MVKSIVLVQRVWAAVLSSVRPLFAPGNSPAGSNGKIVDSGRVVSLELRPTAKKPAAYNGWPWRRAPSKSHYEAVGFPRGVAANTTKS